MSTLSAVTPDGELVNVESFTALGNLESVTFSRAESISIHRLSPADSPRTSGENSRHIEFLSGLSHTLPPIIVHRPTMRVIDGMHRFRVSILQGDNSISVQFFDGSIEEAFVLAMQLNSTNCLPLSAAERSSAAKRILKAFEHWSNAKIAAICGISDKTVARMRRRSATNFSMPLSRVGKDGRVRPIDPARGRLRAGQLLVESPDAPLREIAEAAGIAVGTASDVRQRVRQGKSPLPPRLQNSAGRSDRSDSLKATKISESDQAPASVPSEGYESLMTALKRDPSLRFTNAGRLMLRLLDAHSLTDKQWEMLVAAVPGHCTATIMEAARSCAEFWVRFVERANTRAEA